MKKIAIIMPYYNEVDLLRKSVWAIFNQTYKDWHLFLVDDGSRRGSRAYEVLNVPPEFEKQITFVFKSNGGVSSARNVALNLIYFRTTIEHDYVAYCDSDDVWSPNYLEQQVAALNDEVDMVYGSPDHRFLDGSKAIPYGIADYPEFPGKEKLLESNCIFISGVVHKVKCLDVGYFDESLNSIEDWDYWVRISLAGYRIAKNPNAAFIYTVKMNGNGSKSNKQVYEGFYRKHAWFKG
jgi:glycosyltransferase involved in cell wall biosynthesis